MIISRFIHVAANGIIIFFLKLSNSPLCVYTHTRIYTPRLLYPFIGRWTPSLPSWLLWAGYCAVFCDFPTPCLYIFKAVLLLHFPQIFILWMGHLFPTGTQAEETQPFQGFLLNIPIFQWLQQSDGVGTVNPMLLMRKLKLVETT